MRGRLEPNQRQDVFAAVAVLVQPFFQDCAEGLPELIIALGVVLLAFGQRRQHALGQLPVHDLQLRGVLQHFTADVQRQILAVDQAAHEPQVGRQQLRRIIGDEHPADEQLDLAAALGLEQVEGALGRQIQQGGVLELAFEVEVQGLPRFVERAGDVVVEGLVLLVGDLRLRTQPQRLRLVDLLGLAVLGQQADREGHMIGVEPDQSLQAVGLEELVGVFFQVQDDGGADGGFGAVDIGDGEAAVARTLPAEGVLGASLAGVDRDAIGDHEGAVEADPELTDQGARVLALGHGGGKVGGA